MFETAFSTNSYVYLYQRQLQALVLGRKRKCCGSNAKRRLSTSRLTLPLLLQQSHRASDSYSSMMNPPTAVVPGNGNDGVRLVNTHIQKGIHCFLRVASTTTMGTIYSSTHCGCHGKRYRNNFYRLEHLLTNKCTLPRPPKTISICIIQ